MGGWGGWEESRIKLISAEAEAEALLGLAELGNTFFYCSSSNKIQNYLDFIPG